MKYNETDFQDVKAAGGLTDGETLRSAAGEVSLCQTPAENDVPRRASGGGKSVHGSGLPGLIHRWRDEHMKFRWRRAALAAAVLSLAVLLTACGGKLPGGVTSGLGDLGGLTVEEAQSQLASAFETQVTNAAFTLTYGSASATLSGSVFQLDDTTAVLEDAEGGTPVQLSVSLTSEGEETLNQVLEQLSAEDTVVNTTCTVEDDSLVVVKGTSGISLLGDGGAAARQEVLDWINQGVNSGTLDDLPLSGRETAPGDPDLETLYNDVYTEPVNAELDSETGEIVAHQNGLSFDIAAVRQEIAGLAEGEEAVIPLTVTEPDITTAKLEANLFKDVLGQASSNISSVRLSPTRCPRPTWAA